MLLVFIICIPFTGQFQTLSATSGSINFENSNHVLNGISLSQDVTDFLSVGIERIGGQSEIGSLRMTSSSLRLFPRNLNTSAVRPWIGAGVCYSALTPGLALTPDFADKSSKSDPNNYAIDHAIIISEYSKADYKKMIKASEKNIEMYEKGAVERVNASILYHMLHDKKQDKESQKKDR